MQNFKARVISQVESVKVVIEHVSRSSIILNNGSPDLNAYPDFTTTPPSDDFVTFP